MVITLTTRCKELCTHCMDCCDQNGIDMTMDTLENAVRFALCSGVHVLEISGGEALLHPRWQDCLEKVLAMVQDHVDAGRDPCVVILASNGHVFLEDENVKYWFMHELPRVVGHRFFSKVQVTVDRRFYPNADALYAGMDELKQVLGDRLVLVEELSHLVALGRARSLVKRGVMLDSGKPLSPSCSNPLLVARQVRTWREFVGTFERMGRFCHPFCDQFGRLHVSECISCPYYGNVNTWMRDVRVQHLEGVSTDGDVMDRSCQFLLDVLGKTKCCGKCEPGPHEDVLRQYGLLVEGGS